MARQRLYHQILDEIARVGGVVDRVREGRHRIVYWRVGNRQFTIAASSSPSDWRAARNQISEIRRMARDAHVEK